MTKLIAIAVALAALGCGKQDGAAEDKDPFVQKANAVKQEMCACKDVDCGDAAWDKLERIELDLEASSTPADARERFAKVRDEIRKCRPE